MREGVKEMSDEEGKRKKGWWRNGGRGRVVMEEIWMGSEGWCKSEMRIG